MLVGIVVTLAVFSAYLPLLMQQQQQNVEVITGTVAAQQLQTVVDASKNYISAYASNLEAVATATKPATITVPMLISTGFLPQGTQATNPYGQTLETEVLQPTSGDLEALVLSVGGEVIPGPNAPRIASEAGSEGGVVLSTGYAQGAYGGWSLSMKNYTNPGAGHLAALISYNNGEIQNDYLYRTAVSGQPQLNQMQTNLDMGNNDLNNAKDVNVNDHVQVGTPYNTTGGSAGSLGGQLGVSEPAGEGFPSGWGGGIRTFDLFANGTVGAGTNGTVESFLSSSGVVDAGKQLQLGTADGTAVSGVGCSPDGAVASESGGNGELMVCQGGVWVLNAPTQEYVHNGSSWHNYSWNGSSGDHYVGWYRLCTLQNSWVGGGGGGGGVRIVGGPNSIGQYQWDLDTETDTSDSFMCWN